MVTVLKVINEMHTVLSEAIGLHGGKLNTAAINFMAIEAQTHDAVTQVGRLVKDGASVSRAESVVVAEYLGGRPPFSQLTAKKSKEQILQYFRDAIGRTDANQRFGLFVASAPYDSTGVGSSSGGWVRCCQGGVSDMVPMKPDGRNVRTAVRCSSVRVLPCSGPRSDAGQRSAPQWYR